MKLLIIRPICLCILALFSLKSAMSFCSLDGLESFRVALSDLAAFWDSEEVADFGTGGAATCCCLTSGELVTAFRRDSGSERGVTGVDDWFESVILKITNKWLVIGT